SRGPLMEATALIDGWDGTPGGADEIRRRVEALESGDPASEASCGCKLDVARRALSAPKSGVYGDMEILRQLHQPEITTITFKSQLGLWTTLLEKYARMLSGPEKVVSGVMSEQKRHEQVELSLAVASASGSYAASEGAFGLIVGRRVTWLKPEARRIFLMW